MKVSVIIPAHNAEETISETLESVIAQTYPDWEAIVVDDGSTDDTAAIAESFAKKDRRIYTLSQTWMGASTARNTGIKQARFDWLLFLDADDWILPQYLQRVTSVLGSNSNLDALHCGWAFLTPENKNIGEHHFSKSGDLFSSLAQSNLFQIEACVVRRKLVEAVGGFDPTLRTCEDWDLWQRVARMGAQFGAITDVLARHRLRLNSTWFDATRFLIDGLRVVTQGHSPDPRVSHPDPSYVKGLPSEHLPGARLHFACWPAAIALGRGENPNSLLDILKDDRDPALDPERIAYSIFYGVYLAKCQPAIVWVQLYHNIKQHIDEFLIALEARSLSPNLTRRVRINLERLILEHPTSQRPLTIGETHAAQIEVTEPIENIHLPASVERLRCTVLLDGGQLGILELPVCNGLVSNYVLTDAIAAEFAWQILGRFFEHTVYPELRVERGSSGISLYRGRVLLAEGLSIEEGAFWPQAHDQIGWTIFLQEIWNRKDWSNSRFYQTGWAASFQGIRGRIGRLKSRIYDSKSLDKPRMKRKVKNDWLMVEVGEDLPDLLTYKKELEILFTIGGVAIGLFTIPVKQNIVRAEELLKALTNSSGFELCRAAVREGIIGMPIASQPNSLHARVAKAVNNRFNEQNTIQEDYKNTTLSSGSNSCIHSALFSGEFGLILGRRNLGSIETSVSRRVVFPAAVVDNLIEAAMASNEPFIQLNQHSEQTGRVVYAPDLIPLNKQRKLCSIMTPTRSQNLHSGKVSVHDRHRFETLFARQAHPWKYASQYEQTKCEQTLSLLPRMLIGPALEIDCAEGHFTAKLAPLVGRLTAADTSKTVLSRAAERCSNLENIRFLHLDITKDPLPGQFELIVCSELLYYIGGREELKSIARKLADSLEPGGYLLTAHSNLVVDEPNRTGFDWVLPFDAKVIGEVLASTRPLRMVKELRTPLYRIQLLQHDNRLRIPLFRTKPEIIELTQPNPLLPEVSGYVPWKSGHPGRSSDTHEVTTDKLPILLYHRVSPTGSSRMNKYRVTPEAFEEQLSYLRDKGYYTVSLEDWQTAIEARRPLPGRAVIITFDDGYLDFFNNAWPLLKRYGFTAIVFLVADEIGRSNSWDRVYGEEVPLLGWKEIHKLREEGIEFGSHSASRRHLTGLTPEEIVTEAARSRVIIERELGRPVTAFSYPHGDENRAIQHLIGGCGYLYGMTTRHGLSSFRDGILSLPRIGVTGSDGFREFMAKLT